MPADFPIIRYEYYVAARTLLFNSSFAVTGITFGYAIENAIKQGLRGISGKLSQKEQRLLKTSHDLPRLFQICRRYGLFRETQVSEDFFLFANDHFKQRYPSHRKAVYNACLDSGRQLSFGIDCVFAYDDLICQLEDSLFEVTGDPYNLSGFQAGLDIDGIKGRNFFHCNAAALGRFELFAELVRECPWSDPKTHHLFSNGPDFYWKAKGLFNWWTNWRAKNAQQPALSFKYSMLRPQDRAILRHV